MRPLTIQLDDPQYEALQLIGKENGLDAAEKLVSQQVQRLIASYCGPGVTPGVKEHLKASIAENRRLLERLAQ
jgi:hypothetical protein